MVGSRLSFCPERLIRIVGQLLHERGAACNCCTTWLDRLPFVKDQSGAVDPVDLRMERTQSVCRGHRRTADHLNCGHC